LEGVEDVSREFNDILHFRAFPDKGSIDLPLKDVLTIYKILLSDGCRSLKET
jgi:hypothetical protein